MRREMRSFKFWYEEWQHSYVMAEYWRKHMMRRKIDSDAYYRDRFIWFEYLVRCADAFKEIMRCFNV